MYPSKNYADIFRQFNMTDDDYDIDFDYFLSKFNLTFRNKDRFENARNGVPIISENGSDNNGSKATERSCYCEPVMRYFAMEYSKNYHGYASLIVCSFGTLTNILNIIVLTRKDTKSVPINRILTGMATADVLVMLEYIPFVIYKYFVLPKRRIFPYGLAVFVLFHMHFTQLFHTISIALTLTLAVWRYIAIRFPQHSHIWCTGRRCTIALSWSLIAPVFVCAPSYFVFGINSQTIHENGTKEILYHVDTKYPEEVGFMYQLNFWILGVIKFLPCVLLGMITSWLVNALHRAQDRKYTLKIYGHCDLKTSKPTTALSGFENNEGWPDGEKDEHLRRASRSDKRTDRTTRMLIAVLILFLVTEIPQGILGLLSAIVGDCFFRNCYHKFGELMDILALLNSSINFILYCSMSRQFRMIFGQLFKPRIMNWPTLNQHQTDVQSTYV